MSTTMSDRTLALISGRRMLFCRSVQYVSGTLSILEAELRGIRRAAPGCFFGCGSGRRRFKLYAPFIPEAKLRGILSLSNKSKCKYPACAEASAGRQKSK